MRPRCDQTGAAGRCQHPKVLRALGKGVGWVRLQTFERLKTIHNAAKDLCCRASCLVLRVSCFFVHLGFLFLFWCLSVSFVLVGFVVTVLCFCLRVLESNAKNSLPCDAHTPKSRGASSELLAGKQIDVLCS